MWAGGAGAGAGEESTRVPYFAHNGDDAESNSAGAMRDRGATIRV